MRPDIEGIRARSKEMDSAASDALPISEDDVAALVHYALLLEAALREAEVALIKAQDMLERAQAPYDCATRTDIRFSLATIAKLKE